MSQSLIRQLFESRLASWAAARVPSIRVAYQDVEFTPASGEIYLRCFVLPSSTGSEDLEGVHKIYVGVWQVNIVTPSGSGMGAAESLAAELQALFPNNLPLTSGSFTVSVRTPLSIAQGLPDGLNTITPTSLTYRADTI
ncbi:phage tail terminator-like protein [Pseudomonas sp. S9]|uniref:phage tail terminator-like protein n=1 Tax=Pseudomonas sp. S9 TaxID=686578 RepID=UPI0002556F51|nr:phage tail terminator-like protein [Pseudomonas sp. S9]